MIFQPISHKGYKLFHEGMQALSIVEANGIKIDEDYLFQAECKCKNRISSLKATILGDPIYTKWRKHFGPKTNLGSREQLGTIIFNVMKYPCPVRTATGRPSTDEETLREVDIPFVQNYMNMEKWKKALNTFLAGIKRETVDEYLHPFFNLHTTATFRSSSDSPNFQNFPIRRPEIAKLIRSAFIPRNSKRRLIEFDFKGIEVSVAACYNKDPKLIEYITDSTTDMHRDMSTQCFILDVLGTDLWWKDKQPGGGHDVRQAAKGDFVFPEFYGNWYKAVAKDLWKSIKELKLATNDGTPLKQHLKEQGIKGLGKCDPELDARPGTFEYHIKQVEDDFWNNRFRVYNQWKRDWNDAYIEKGYFDTLTGFRCSALMNRKQVVNFPIQGCLAGDSRVLTDKGLIPIKELVGVSTKVWTGFKWADAVGIDRGVYQRAQIKLSSGIILQCDTRHKLKNEHDEWIDFENLQIGDYVALPQTRNTLNPSKNTNWWFLLGFILGDGCISNERRKSLSISVGEVKKKDIISIYKFLLSEGYNNTYGGVHFKKRNNKYILWIQSKKLAAFLESKGIHFGSNAHSKRIPSSVWIATPQEQRDFLEGLWKSDGSRVKWQEHNLSMCNKKLLQEVQILSSSLGYDSHLEQTKCGWLLYFSERKFNSKSHRKYPSSTLHRLVKSVDRNKYENRNQWITDKRNFLSFKDVTQYTGERIIQKGRKDSPQVYRYDKIVNITICHNKEKTYTMSVDDSLHQFVADGVIHKNSAFHCLLWSLIQIQKLLTKYKMKSLIVGQIHDSIIMDVVEKELKAIMKMVKQVTTIDLPKHWSFIIVPMRIDCEVSEPGKSWYEKKELKF